MEGKSNKNKIILIIIFSILLILLLLYNLKNDSNDDNKVIESKINLLDDYSRFFTINSCVYKYITYVQSKDVNSILKVLNKDYVNTNSINESNVLNYVENLNGNYSFKTKKVYYEKINDDVFKYYVYGQLSLDTIDGYSDKSDRYYIVMFDIENQLFDITPFDEVGFKEVYSE